MRKPQSSASTPPNWPIRAGNTGAPASPNFVATPHLGASTVEAQDNVAFQVAERQQNMFQDFFDKMAVMAEAESQNNSHSD